MLGNIPNLNGSFYFEVEDKPVSDKLKINYSIPQPANVSIVIYDTANNLEMYVVNEYGTVGTHSMIIDISSFRMGVYFCKMKAGEFTESKRFFIT